MNETQPAVKPLMDSGNTGDKWDKNVHTPVTFAATATAPPESRAPRAPANELVLSTGIRSGRCGEGPIPPHELSVSPKERLQLTRKNDHRARGRPPLIAAIKCRSRRRRARSVHLALEDLWLVTNDKQLDLGAQLGRLKSQRSTRTWRRTR
jgi:hypothetical protein